MVEVEGTVTEEMLNNMATRQCECEEAKSAQNSEKVQLTAEENVEKLFRSEFPDTASILKAAVLPIMSGMMDSIVIDTGRKVKGRVSVTRKGNIKVERIETKKMSLEG